MLVSMGSDGGGVRQRQRQRQRGDGEAGAETWGDWEGNEFGGYEARMGRPVDGG